jgi:hypothetical protein
MWESALYIFNALALLVTSYGIVKNQKAVIIAGGALMVVVAALLIVVGYANE